MLGRHVNDRPYAASSLLADLLHRRVLATDAIDRLEAMHRAQTLTEADDGVTGTTVEEPAEAVAAADEDVRQPGADRVPLARQRQAAALAALAEIGAARVLDLGCGTGALIADLVKDRALSEIVGVDVSPQVLEVAHRRLRLADQPERQRGRVRLLQSALTYADARLTGYDAAVLMEVIEHVDESRLPDLVGSVFGHAGPAAVIVTTPNVEYNVRYDGLAGSLRHPDPAAGARPVRRRGGDPGHPVVAGADRCRRRGHGGQAVRRVRGRARRRPVRPGLKCRGREYLRIIYGPDYTEPGHLARLRGRSLGRKRSLALREYVLGLAALDRAAAGEPPWRVHEAVFATLACDSEPTDPRL
jgi:2-polyprenyl-3-methyl-5-hydroxy-6-metoxy-1,4-benzoquinol methylase